MLKKNKNIYITIISFILALLIFSSWDMLKTFMFQLF
jgi:hypothetical protein